jgi:hypothetical protein
VHNGALLHKFGSYLRISNTFCNFDEYTIKY